MAHLFLPSVARRGSSVCCGYSVILSLSYNIKHLEATTVVIRHYRNKTESN